MRKNFLCSPLEQFEFVLYTFVDMVQFFGNILKIFFGDNLSDTDSFLFNDSFLGEFNDSIVSKIEGKPFNISEALLNATYIDELLLEEIQNENSEDDEILLFVNVIKGGISNYVLEEMFFLDEIFSTSLQTGVLTTTDDSEFFGDVFSAIYNEYGVFFEFSTLEELGNLDKAELDFHKNYSALVDLFEEEEEEEDVEVAFFAEQFFDNMDLSFYTLFTVNEGFFSYMFNYYDRLVNTEDYILELNNSELAMESYMMYNFIEYIFEILPERDLSKEDQDQTNYWELNLEDYDFNTLNAEYLEEKQEELEFSQYTEELGVSTEEELQDDFIEFIFHVVCEDKFDSADLQTFENELNTECSEEQNEAADELIEYMLVNFEMSKRSFLNSSFTDSYRLLNSALLSNMLNYSVLNIFGYLPFTTSYISDYFNNYEVANQQILLHRLYKTESNINLSDFYDFFYNVNLVEDVSNQMSSLSFYLNSFNTMIFLIIGGLLFYFYILRSNSMSYITATEYVFESLFFFIGTLVEQQVGLKGYSYFPVFFFIFLFVTGLNVIGMLPFSFTVTGQLLFTFYFGFSLNLGFLFLGFYLHGLSFLKFFVPSGVPQVLLPLIVVIEVFSYMIRTFSLSIRLFVNMMAGHCLLFVVSSFVFGILSASYFFGIFVGLIYLALFILELAIAFLQAYVFTILGVIYLNDAIKGGEGH